MDHIERDTKHCEDAPKKTGEVLNTHGSLWISTLFDGGDSLSSDVRFEKSSQFDETIWNPRDELVHPSQVSILVRIQQALEFRVEYFQMFLYEDAFASLSQALVRRCVEVHLHSLLLLQQSLLGLIK